MLEYTKDVLYVLGCVTTSFSMGFLAGTLIYMLS